MKISVVIPTYNRAGLLAQAIESVLDQRHPELEVIVSDNCSTDETEAVVSRYRHDPRLRYFRNEANLGMVGNWRRAIYERASADWFVLLSDDDYFIDRDYLAQASALIEAHPEVQYVYAGGYILDEQGNQTLLKLPFDGIVDGRIVFGSRNTVTPQDLTLCNVVFPVARARELGFLRNPDNLSCDSELCLRLALQGPVGVINRPVSVYRQHSGNLVKTIMTSVTRMVANLDAFVGPYSAARARGEFALAESYRKNLSLDQTIHETLIRARCLGWGAFNRARLKVKKESPVLYAAVLLRRRFWTRLFKVSLRPAHYRMRFELSA